MKRGENPHDRILPEKSNSKLKDLAIRIEKKISAPRKICLVNAFLPFGTVGEACSYCTLLQIAQTCTNTKNCKKVLS